LGVSLRARSAGVDVKLLKIPLSADILDEEDVHLC